MSPLGDGIGGPYMKSILLIGLGRFGYHMALKFRELHHEVLAIDRNETRVNQVLPYVTNAQIADCTNEKFIKSLGVRNFDVCIVAIGSDFQSSLEITALLKDNGAPLVLSRASSDVHGIVYPEKQIANWAAVCYSSESIFDYVQLTPDYSIYEVSMPPSWVGKTLAALAVRQKYNINVLATKKANALDPLTGPDHVFLAEERLLIMGHNKDLEKFLHL